MDKSKVIKPRSHARFAPRGSTDLLEILRNLVPELHTAELQIAKLILSDPTWVSNNSIKAIATRADVSEPTVMRLCRKLGQDGFAAFKRKLAEDLVIAKMYLEAEEVSKSSSPASITETMQTSASQALKEAAARLDAGALERATGLIAAARMVYCFGVGGSSAIFAAEAENRMFRLNVNAQATADPYRQRMTAAIVGPDEVLLSISSTGLPNSIVESAALARSNGAKVISITQADSPLAKESTEVLAVDMFDDEVFFNLPSRTRYAQLFVLDCLMASLAAKLPSAVENLRTIRSTLGALHGVTKLQPIGD
ncbi:MurR/RpiR family transcriptional regulator [Rhodobacteraceae bacterium CCMM004]|nr:MurR/RpiR family transcriptional regulator [Rhodobacteraceae bacterium CCMM004]